MNATGLPISLTSVEATPKAGAPAATKPSAEFPLMLGQSAGASAETAPLLQAEAASAEEAIGPEVQEAEPMAGLPLAIPAAFAEPSEPRRTHAVAALAERKLEPAVLERGVHSRLPGNLLEQKVAADSTSGSPGALLPGAAPIADQSSVLRTAAQADLMGFRPLQTPVGSAAWTDELGTRLTWMAERGQHTASLRLTPEHLGPLEVRITIRDDQASIWFGAAHADTRAAIEHALPRLRELFASEGLALADAGVFHEPPQQSSHAHTPGSAAGEESAAQTEVALSSPRAHLGLLDAYA